MHKNEVIFMSDMYKRIESLCKERGVNITQMCKDAGVALTPAGATYPYGKDPKNSNIRIAPSFPSVSDIEQAVNVLAVCAKITAIDKILEA